MALPYSKNFSFWITSRNVVRCATGHPNLAALAMSLDGSAHLPSPSPVEALWAIHIALDRASTAFEANIRKLIALEMPVPCRHPSKKTARDLLIRHGGLCFIHPGQEGYDAALTTYIESVTGDTARSIMTLLGYHHDITSYDFSLFMAVHGHRFADERSHPALLRDTFPSLYQATIAAIFRHEWSEPHIAHRLEDLALLGLVLRAETGRPYPKKITITQKGVALMHAVIEEERAHIRAVLSNLT